MSPIYFITLVCVVPPVLRGESRLGLNVAIDELSIRHAAMAGVDLKIAAVQSADEKVMGFNRLHTEVDFP